jgi:hypothetical protein
LILKGIIKATIFPEVGGKQTKVDVDDLFRFCGDDKTGRIAPKTRWLKAVLKATRGVPPKTGAKRTPAAW